MQSLGTLNFVLVVGQLWLHCSLHALATLTLDLLLWTPAGGCAECGVATLLLCFAGPQVFFCKYNDPIYVKMEKLEIMIKLASEKNIDQVRQACLVSR